MLLYNECKDTGNLEHYFADSAILYIYITAMEYYNDNKFEFASNRINLCTRKITVELLYVKK